MLKKFAIHTVVTLLGLAACFAAHADPVAPSYEPFFASRMWGFAFGPRAAMPVSEESVLALEGLLEEMGSAGFARGAARFAELDPGLSMQQRMAWAMVPFAVLQLEGLPPHGRWDALELRLAAAVFGIAGSADPDLPRPALGESPEANQESRRAIDAWFMQRAREPQVLGHMIFTLDDGPWLPFPLAEECTPTESKSVSAELSLRLCRLDDGGWAVEAFRDGAPAWSRELTEIPALPLRFSPAEPLSLGAYGWRVDMTFGELVHFYLDRRYEPMFYFTSW